VSRPRDADKYAEGKGDVDAKALQRLAETVTGLGTESRHKPEAAEQEEWLGDDRG
jgi:hypothetical protein